MIVCLSRYWQENLLLNKDGKRNSWLEVVDDDQWLFTASSVLRCRHAKTSFAQKLSLEA